MVEVSVRNASDWMKKYSKKSALAKFFKSQSEQRKWLVVKSSLDDALRTLGMDQQVVIEQLTSKCSDVRAPFVDNPVLNNSFSAL